jgi:hypothetical protein
MFDLHVQVTRGVIRVTSHSARAHSPQPREGSDVGCQLVGWPAAGERSPSGHEQSRRLRQASVRNGYFRNSARRAAFLLVRAGQAEYRGVDAVHRVAQWLVMPYPDEIGAAHRRSFNMIPRFGPGDVETVVDWVLSSPPGQERFELISRHRRDRAFVARLLRTIGPRITDDATAEALDGLLYTLFMSLSGFAQGSASGTHRHARLALWGRP